MGNYFSYHSSSRHALHFANPSLCLRSLMCCSSALSAHSLQARLYDIAALTSLEALDLQKFLYSSYTTFLDEYGSRTCITPPSLNGSLSPNCSDFSFTQARKLASAPKSVDSTVQYVFFFHQDCEFHQCASNTMLLQFHSQTSSKGRTPVFAYCDLRLCRTRQ